MHACFVLNCTRNHHIYLYLYIIMTTAVQHEIKMSSKADQWRSQPDNLVPLCKFQIVIIIQFISLVIIYMKKFLHSDWLRAVQFLGNSVPKRELNSVQISNHIRFLILKFSYDSCYL